MAEFLLYLFIYSSLITSAIGTTSEKPPYKTDTIPRTTSKDNKENVIVTSTIQTSKIVNDVTKSLNGVKSNSDGISNDIETTTKTIDKIQDIKTDAQRNGNINESLHKTVMNTTIVPLSTSTFENKSQTKPSVSTTTETSKENVETFWEKDKTTINFSSGQVIDDPKLELSTKPNSKDKIDLQGHLTTTKIYDQTSHATNITTIKPMTSSIDILTKTETTTIKSESIPPVTPSILQELNIITTLSELLNLTTVLPNITHRPLSTEFDQILEHEQTTIPTLTTSASVSSAIQVNSSDTIWPVKHAAVVEGELVLGGLMMVHEREDSITCGPVMPQGGIQALEAMLYTMDRINADPTILPNISLGAHILDDCDKDTYGLEMAVDFIKG